jgi:integrase
LLGGLTTTGKIGGLVFPSADANGTETKTWGKLHRHLDRAALIAGIEKRIKPPVFRVADCAARLRAMDNGAPVATWTVKTETGHSSLSMIEKVYGRLGIVRHRLIRSPSTLGTGCAPD